MLQVGPDDDEVEFVEGVHVSTPERLNPAGLCLDLTHCAGPAATIFRVAGFKGGVVGNGKGDLVYELSPRGHGA